MQEMTMASTISKMQGTSREGTSSLLGKLGKLFHLSALDSRGDDPICLSALDATTLRRYGYSESQITLMKEGSLR
jgi:hypothetical protein